MNKTLTLVEAGGIRVWTDAALAADGVVIAFSERSGGASSGAFASLNLAAHVGDDPARVDENRTRLLSACGLDALASRLVTAEQVHGERVAFVADAHAGAGAFASGGRPPIGAADALVTAERDVPLLLCFADCVPVIVAAPGPVVGVAHAGWRGALAGIPGSTVRAVAEQASCEPCEVVAYVGAHIGACHYQVADDLLSQFVNTFGTLARAESGGLDLGRVVAASLTHAGVDPCRIASLGTCTAETTDRFYSHRAEAGLTGRHGALVCIPS